MRPGLKLCVVCAYPPDLGGQADFGWHMVHGLARTGRFRAVTVLTAKNTMQDSLPGGEQQDRDGIISVRAVWARDQLATAWRLVRAIREEAPDAVWFSLGLTLFGHSRVACFLGCAIPMLVQRMGIPTIVTLHEVYEAAEVRGLGVKNGWLTTLGVRTTMRMLAHVEALCLTLRRYVTLVQHTYGIDNAHYMPLGVYVRPEALARPPAAPEQNILMFTAYAPHKGLRVLLEALPHVQRALPAATLSIAGTDHPRYLRYLAGERARANHAPGIRWLGPRTHAQLRDDFARAQVVVLPYLATTGASSALYYAMAYGRPVIASDLPDLRATAEEMHLRAEYTAPGDPLALAEALKAVLANPAQQDRRSAHNVQVARGMTLERTCARYADLFEAAAMHRVGALEPWPVT